MNNKNAHLYSAFYKKIIRLKMRHKNENKNENENVF